MNESLSVDVRLPRCFVVLPHAGPMKRNQRSFSSSPLSIHGSSDTTSISDPSCRSERRLSDPTSKRKITPFDTTESSFAVKNQFVKRSRQEFPVNDSESNGNVMLHGENTIKLEYKQCQKNCGKGLTDGCQRFDPTTENKNLCDNCGHTKGFHQLIAYINEQPYPLSNEYQLTQLLAQLNFIQRAQQQQQQQQQQPTCHNHISPRFSPIQMFPRSSQPVYSACSNSGVTSAKFHTVSSQNNTQLTEQSQNRKQTLILNESVNAKLSQEKNEFQASANLEQTQVGLLKQSEQISNNEKNKDSFENSDISVKTSTTQNKALENRVVINLSDRSEATHIEKENQIPKESEDLQKYSEHLAGVNMEDLEISYSPSYEDTNNRSLPMNAPNFPAYFSKLSFLVQFVIESLVSRSLLSRAEITSDFCKKLNSMSIIKALQQLEQKTNELNSFQRDKRVALAQGFLVKYLSSDEPTSSQSTAKSQKNSLRNQVLAFNATVTPQGNFIFEGPYLKSSNRVTRQFGCDRFLQVKFTIDYKKSGNHLFKVKEVYKKVLKNGITVGDRHYEFLAFSASQLREGKCSFFASNISKPGKHTVPKFSEPGYIPVNDVRKWLGDFSSISSLAKFGARLGQAFSSTIPTIIIPPEQLTIEEDVKNDKYCFTDGCGQISKELAHEVAKSLGLDFTPSAFQVRLGPYKGVLCLDLNIQNKIIFRQSMKKYDTQLAEDAHRTLEVIKYSKPSSGHLNRQFIVLLSALGVNTDYIQKLQKEDIDNTLSLFTNPKQALRQMQLQKADDEDNIRNKAISMLLAGHDSHEPYLQTLLCGFQRTRLRQLKDKARIPVTNSRKLLGVADFTKTLQYGQVFVQISSAGMSMVIRGKVVCTKNPCVHPGDIRLLEAVDVPQLRHLVDCVVFPIQGERPHPDEIAGSDLDGDQYFVSWDDEFVKISPHEPDQSGVKEITVPIPSSGVIDALINYYVNSIFSASLGVIANLHLAWSDLYGAKSTQCLELARLHSRAVDAAKTGDDVRIPQYLFGNKGYPHYMERTPSYKSTTILGILYDDVLKALQELREKQDQLRAKEVILDKDLLVDGRESFKKEARALLKQYNSEVSEICQSTENDTEKRKEMMDVIIVKYRKKFLEDQLSLDEYLLKASACYDVTYTRNKNSLSKVAVSFPWNIADDFLNMLKSNAAKKLSGSERLPIVVHDSMISHLRFRFS